MQHIPLEQLIMRDDLDPRLGVRDYDHIEQYISVFDSLPPIEINQHNEIIDGWHRYLAAERARIAEIAYVVVETVDDDDLADKMWNANVNHGVPYQQHQRKAYGIKLHGRGLEAKEIAKRAGVSLASVNSWTKDIRDIEKLQRDRSVFELATEGKTQQQIADKLEVPQRTISRILSQNTSSGILAKDNDLLHIDRVPDAMDENASVWDEAIGEVMEIDDMMNDLDLWVAKRQQAESRLAHAEKMIENILEKQGHDDLYRTRYLSKLRGSA